MIDIEELEKHLATVRGHIFDTAIVRELIEEVRSLRTSASIEADVTPHSLSPETAYALFTQKHPNATLKDAFTAAWQMATVRSPEATDDETDATFRRCLGLRIRNLTVTAKGELTWLAIECKGVVQGLYPLGTRAKEHPYCTEHCKTMCQNSTHGVCDGVPKEAK